MKTPKEEAKELVDRFKGIENLREVTKRGKMYLNIIEAKECALICVKDKVKFIMELQVSDLMKYDLVEYEMRIQIEIEKL